jgi:hypothetical protein
MRAWIGFVSIMRLVQEAGEKTRDGSKKRRHGRASARCA